MVNFKEQFEKHLIPSIFYIEENNKFNLKEEGQYTVEVTQCKKNSLIIIKSSKVKQHAKYLNKNCLPKDCDYILINSQKEVLFFIELKSRDNNATVKSIKKQLLAGKKWFEHVLFVSDLPFDIIKDFRVIPILIRVNQGRYNGKSGDRFNLQNGLYISNGEKIDLRNYYNKGVSIKLEDFKDDWKL